MIWKRLVPDMIPISNSWENKVVTIFSSFDAFSKGSTRLNDSSRSFSWEFDTLFTDIKDSIILSSFDALLIHIKDSMIWYTYADLILSRFDTLITDIKDSIIL